MANENSELVAVEDENTEENGGVDKTESSSSADDEGEGEGSDKKKPQADDASADDDDDDDEEKPDGDQRASSEASAEAEDEDRRKKARESSAERRKRQREARERLERELNYYRGRNEQLERRFSGVEAQLANQEKLTLAQMIEQTESQLAQAKKIEAEAIAAQDGEAAVEARDIAQALATRHSRLLNEKRRIERPASQQQDKTPPPAMRAAFSWIKANKDWYDPNGGNEDSVLASVMEDKLYREGRLDPATQAFWDELDRRLVARGIGKKAAESEDVDDEDAEDDNGGTNGAHRSANSKPAGERKDARMTKSSGGPKISVGGANRALKANEVYVSPERKAAMQELGAWDDPVLKQKLLRDYQRYDREAAAAAAGRR